MTNDQLFIVALVVAFAGVVVPVAGNILVFITLLAGYIFSWITSRENRRRDLEDRKEVADKVAKVSEVAIVTATKLDTVHSAVLDVGVKATKAYDVANEVGIKFQAVMDASNASRGILPVPVTHRSIAEAEEKQKEA